MSRRKVKTTLGILAYTAVLAVLLLSLSPDKTKADFDANILTSDGKFTDINRMDAAAIQRFLVSKGSFLKDFSEGGRTAAQIIYDAAHGRNEAAGSINGITINESTGTVNPEVIIVTLQKETGIVFGTNAASRKDNLLEVAMGYACPDSGGRNPAYIGFTKQVENAAWQLRYNYERAQGRGFGDYQVGQSFSFDDWNGTHSGTFGNRATASLYRYTPHVYSGNYNFYTYINNWFASPEFSYSFAGQNAYPALKIGDSYNFVVQVRNTGYTTWKRGEVNLGTSRDQDRIPMFLREGNGPSGWTSPNRVQFQEATVAPGEIATYSFWMKNNHVSPGTYREYFRVVADGVYWLEDYGIYWDVKVPTIVEQYAHSFAGQNEYPTMNIGDSYNFVVQVRNTGYTTWKRGEVNLGTSRDQDRIPMFLREGNGPSGWTSPNRVQFQEATVAPGEIATYSFWMKNNHVSPGTYREYFRVVADGICWMEEYGIYWDIKVNG